MKGAADAVVPNSPAPRPDDPALEELADRLQRRLPGRVARRVPFAELTTYRLGGPAAILLRAVGVDDLEVLAEERRRLSDPTGAAVPVLAVGRGSNLLVADRGFPGVAVVLEGDFVEVALSPREVRAGGGVALPVLARRAAAAGLGGLEFYVGIPGSVGGAVRMNAGGHGRETAEVLTGAVVVDLDSTVGGVPRSVDSLGLGYRHSALRPTELVVEAGFRAAVQPPGEGAARLAEIVAWRRANQPGGPNAGSVFSNPPGDSAGRLIDACGLKGLRVGGAVVSPRHANFFQAEPGATATDVARLVAEVRRRVLEATGVALAPELRLVGFEEDALWAH